MATPFQVASPCSATAYPRLSSSSPSRSMNASSGHLVSCRQTTSGRRSSSHGTRRGTRCLTELTFQVAMRTALADRLLGHVAGHQTGVHPAQRQELLVAPALGDRPAAQHHDLV